MRCKVVVFSSCFPIYSSLKKDLSTTPRPLTPTQTSCFQGTFSSQGIYQPGSFQPVPSPSPKIASVRSGGLPNGGNREGRMVGCKRFLGFPKAYVLTRFFFEIQCLQLNMWGFFLKFMSCMKIPWDGCQLLGSYWPTENHKSVPSLNSLCGKCQVQMHVSAHYRPFAGVGALVLMMYMLNILAMPPTQSQWPIKVYVYGIRGFPTENVIILVTASRWREPNISNEFEEMIDGKTATGTWLLLDHLVESGWYVRKTGRHLKLENLIQSYLRSSPGSAGT